MDPVLSNASHKHPPRGGHSAISYISGMFARGLMLILPLAITVYLLFWLARALESALGGLLKVLLPEGGYFRYIPGYGLMAGVLLIFLLGFLLQSGLFRHVWTWAEKHIDAIPLVRLIYGSVKEIISYVGGAQTAAASSVVIVTLQDGVRMVGLVTRENLKGVADGIGDEDVAVFLPWSYQVGGISVYVPRSRITPLDMTVEQGFRFAFTAGVSGVAAKAGGTPLSTAEIAAGGADDRKQPADAPSAEPGNPVGTG